MNLETYFNSFKKHVIGDGEYFNTPDGKKPLLYADWTASGRLYSPIESVLIHKLGPYVANTHTETNVSGSSMTMAYAYAKQLIKKHVNASPNDVIITSNAGMTGVVNKFQRILGLKIHENFRPLIDDQLEKPVVFVSHMEHHSNQTSWLETIAEVVVIPPDAEGLVSLDALKNLLKEFKDRKIKIAAITSCSNVTGIFTPYYEIAEIMHLNGGWCFVDFACSAPYISIDMHPHNAHQYLDAIYFSPHKFLGGPGSSGVLIFNQSLYKNRVPDHPGGGTVDWTNPWGEHKYLEKIELREDGGTPGFLQTIKAALAIQLKEEMGVENIATREHQMVAKIIPALKAIPKLHLLADQHANRLGIFSFYIEGLHFNLGVKLLNDKFGIQVRGGCSCAGTYGHYLLEVSRQKSNEITHKIDVGDLSEKPGWIRWSVHPIMSDEEIDYIISSIEALVLHFEDWKDSYQYDLHTNEFVHHTFDDQLENKVISWFDAPSKLKEYNEPENIFR
ncbi:MAG: hypothetical protein RLZZ248_1729 [Bacteroidota bacterium]|jgi:selenocysteine lyase/cysteine desulfurase